MLTKAEQIHAAMELSQEVHVMVIEHAPYQVQAIYHLVVNIMVPILQQKELYAVLQPCLIILKATMVVVAHLD